MTALITCPRCGGAIHVRLSGVLGPRSGVSQIAVVPESFSMRRHARCFDGPHGGGEPLPVEVAA